MKILTVMIAMLLLSAGAHAAESKIKVEITSLENIGSASAMEACGTAKHSDGLKPVLVTVKHGESKYTTLTSPDGEWCVVIKRWTFNGQIDAHGVL